MKVKKLKMRGFLTYKDEVTIDFAKLYDKKIFLISGPTGSGKTTIFDAIAFALYEKVPRDISMENLRSDYLTEVDPYTYVDLEFRVADRLYQIVRVPSQRAVEIKNPKNIGHRVELYDITNDKILIADKIKDASDAIKEIIGLDESQFTKVMLLAQGQFQKFLISKSDEKAKLLSDIFKTDAQKAIQDRLKDMAKESRDKISEIDKNLGNVISYNEILAEKIEPDLILRHDFPLIEKTTGEIIKTYNSKLDLVKNSIDRLKSKEKDLIQTLEKAKTTNENIEKYKNADITFTNLSQDLDKNSKIKNDLKLLDYAISIEIYEKRLAEEKNDLEKLCESLNNTESDLIKKNTELKKLSEDVKLLGDKKASLDELKIKHSQKLKEISDFDEFIKIKDKFESVKDLENKSEVLKKDIEKVDLKLESLRKDFDKDNQIISQKKEESYKLREKIADTRQRLENLNKDYSKLGQNINFKEDLDDLSKKLSKVEKDEEKALAEKDLFEINKMIDRLNHEGECPVCGKAYEGHKEKHALTGLDLDEIRKILSDIRLEIERLRAIYEKNQNDLAFSYSYQEIKNIIRENEEILASYNDLSEENKSQIESLSKKQKGLESEIKSLIEIKKEKENEYRDLSIKLEDFEEIKVKYLASQKAMEASDRDILISDAAKFEFEIENISNFISQTEKSYNDLNLAINSLKSKKDGISDNIEKTRSNIKIYEKDFEEKRSKEFASEEIYRNFLAKKEELSQQKNYIENYFKDLEREKTLRDSLADYKNLEIKNLETFERDLEEIARGSNILDGEKIALSSKIDRLNEDFSLIKNIGSDFEKIKSKGQIVSHLSDLANGVTGSVKGVEKLDFETFILSVYFDKVLQYANIRFNKMTDGQFSMVRKAEALDLRSKMGLDIEILDANTGKKRPAATLSGGENFLASLSLALGLSDEIAAENGGIRIDTLFIDEGFGSLSHDFLSKAIETIENLSKEDRFVGLISHVDELKDAIEAKILISYDPSEGSSLEILND